MTEPLPGQPERLPIKLILPDQGVSRSVGGRGSSRPPFRPVTDEFRQSIDAQLGAIERALEVQSGPVGAVPVRVKLVSKAVAKSHRPHRLFSPNTCPIIGAGGLGELFVKATPGGIRALRRDVQAGQTAQVVRELSSLETIEAVTPDFRRRRRAPLDILKASPRKGKGFLTKVKLFDFRHVGGHEQLERDFLAVCREQGVSVTRAGYDPGSLVFGVECADENQVQHVSQVVGVRSIAPMPVLRAIRPRVQNQQPLPPSLPDRSHVDGEVPIVVVVDTGVTDRIASLESWVVGRETYVAEKYRNPAHGSFVAGLVVWGGQLNPMLRGVSQEPCAVFDLQVIPNLDPSVGDTEAVTEQEFLQALEEALMKYSHRFKVWNLSIGTDEVCSLDRVSELAAELDTLQERYKVSLVIAAGNYETVPLLDFPRQPVQIDRGRITSPADSALGIAVGSISHLGYQVGGPKEHEPAPFSRHGAGPNHIIKPDLVHYGGTCTTDGSHVAGVRSLTPNGTAEDIGTSFAAPLVSRALAHVYHQITPVPDPVLARALLTHHASDPRTGERIGAGDEDYFGFGRPVPPPYCLECQPNQSTLVFNDVLRPGFFLEWDDFPYPPGLIRDGKYYGEVWMTLAFVPGRGSQWGTEYCEGHVDAKFGVYRPTREGTPGVKPRFETLVPPEHKNPGSLYESVQVRELRKWAPVRTYHGDLRGGEPGTRWRLKLQLLTRHEEEIGRVHPPQAFSLIVTISDPARQVPVYDQMAQIIRNRYRSENLTLRPPIRLRPRT